MGDKLLEQSKKYKKKHTEKRKRKQVFHLLAGIMVFCTTYALILPAITMEKTSYCGYEEHEHSEKCYLDELICAIQEAEEGPTHTHEEECFRQEKTLLCAEEEIESHIHTEECKTYEQIIVCEIEESKEHTHVDTCYQTTESVVCGKEETEGHVHVEECYGIEDVLICQLDEEIEESEEHTHDENCYEKKCVCEKEVHEHTLICYSNPNANLETAADWEVTLPKELSGNWSEDVISVAKSQLGYKESSQNYNVTEDGRTLGYTRFGDWYGDAYGDWCAMFVSFCLNYAEVDQAVFPRDCNCQNWIKTLSEETHNLYRVSGEYEPCVGDLVFFDWDEDKKAEHIGLVVEYTPATEDKTGEVLTIEGNASDMVKYETYKANDSQIMGYGELPKNPDFEEAMKKQTIEASIYTDDTFATEAKEDKTVITVSGYFPKGIEVKAYPVELEEDAIEGRRVFLAYDITLFDKDGNVFDAEESEIPMTVTIEPAEWTIEDEKVDSEDCTIYYLPEEGEPESMETSTEKDVVSFQTDHFSTYVLTVNGTLAEVYLNGASGDDTNDGKSATKAVKTLDKAFSLVANGGTIYITGTVTISENEEIDVEDGKSIVIKRYSSFTGALITVASGGNLTLGNIRVHGGTSGPSTNSIETTTTYAEISSWTYAKAPLIVVQNGGSLSITDGAVLEYNSNRPNSVPTTGYVGQGGAVYCQGNLTMSGGTIQYCEALSGGGIYIESANRNRITFNLSGGTVQYNYAREIKGTSDGARKNPYHSNAGGGIYVGDYVTMNMSGGDIAYNQSAREGGGISLGWLDRKDGSAIDEFITTFNMTGGTFTGNTATSTGGGLNITAGREAYISAGTFTYNKANGREFQPKDSSNMWNVYSGGAIYIDAAQYNESGGYGGKPGYAVINRVIVTQNKATSAGGGIACCATSNTSFNASVDFKNGTAIYENTAPYDSYYRYYLGNEMYLGGTIKLNTEYILGGTTRYSWNTNSYTYDNKKYYYYDNNLTDDSAAIKEAYKVYTVMISNNEAYLGGGIGCNGQIEIGGEQDTVSISITKIWEDYGLLEHPEYITVQILRNGTVYGEPIKIYKSKDAGGNEIWPTYHLDGLPSGYTYSISEVQVPGFESTIMERDNHFIITNKLDGFKVIKKWLDEEGNEITIDLPKTLQVQLYQNDMIYGEVVELTADRNWLYVWVDLPEADESGKEYIYTVKEVDIPDGFYSTSAGELVDGDWIITNVKSPETSISVEKKWADGTPGMENVTVQLLANGKVYGNSVVLNSGNSWFHRWEELPKLDKEGKEIDYLVNEIPINGYKSSVELGEITVQKGKWTTASTLTNGQTYMFVNGTNALADNGSGGIEWKSVTDILESGVKNPALTWKVENSSNSWKLVSGLGNYLYINSSNTRKITTNNIGSSFKFDSSRRLYATLDRWNYYLTQIKDSAGSTSTSSSSGIKFTYYQHVSEKETPGDKHFIVTNTKGPETISVNFAKYATGNGDPTLLAGAELALYRQEDSETVIPGTAVSGILMGEWTSKDATHESKGIHTLTLESGTYYLIETKVPEGHAGLEQPIIFEVDAENNQITIIQYPKYEEVGLQVNNGSVDFPIYNEILYELPETGGIGTNMFTAGGAVLMSGSLFVGYLMKHKRERRFQ